MKRTKESFGFTLVEMLITLAVFTIILGVAIPATMRWYRLQQFYEDVNRVESTLRAGQFNALSSGRWNMVVVHKTCPFGSGKPCVQRFRLPEGQCGVNGGWPSWGGVQACQTATNPGPTVLCEYRQDRWSFPDIPQIAMNFKQTGLGNFAAYVISPSGFIGIQVNPQILSGECLNMIGPNIFLINGTAQYPNLQMSFQYTATAPQFYKGMCLWGAGRIADAPPQGHVKNENDLQCI